MSFFLEVQGRKVEAQWWGEADNSTPAMVLLHEGLGCTALWKQFPQQLARTLNCRVFAYSRLGYGHSDPCPLPRPTDFMHREARETLPGVLEAAGIDQYHLLGHSDGGSIALIHAATQPRGLKNIITEAAHVFCEPITLKAIAKAKDAYRNDTMKQKLTKYHGKNTDTAFRGWNDVWLSPEFVHWNIESCLANIQVPCLALQGESDPYGSPAQLTAIQNHVPLCTSHLIPFCGHTPHKEQPLPTLTAIIDFI